MTILSVELETSIPVFLPITHGNCSTDYHQISPFCLILHIDFFCLQKVTFRTRLWIKRLALFKYLQGQ